MVLEAGSHSLTRKSKPNHRAAKHRLPLLRAGLPKGWKVADKTGNNGKDALGDIAVAWPAASRPIVICAYTQGGRPEPEIMPPILAGVGRMVGAELA